MTGLFHGSRGQSFCECYFHEKEKGFYIQNFAADILSRTHLE